MREWLIATRKSKDLTQADVAKLAGITQPALCNIEQGIGLRPATAKKIAAVLGVDWTRFYDDDEGK